MAVGPIEESPAVRLELQSTAEAPSLARGALSAAFEQMSISSELLDDVKTAVTEACNNAVMHGYDGIPGPLTICMYLEPASVEIVVRDYGVGIADDVPDDEQEQGLGLPIIRALAQDAVVRRSPDGGTEVRMQFSAQQPHELVAAPDDEWMKKLSGDAVASISPLSLLDGVLGRVTRALAARARFSLDRFSDISLTTDLIARHATAAAAAGRIAFGLSTDTRHLELTIGPLRPGASAALDLRVPVESAGSALSLLADDVAVVKANDDEMIRVVIEEQRESR